MKYSEEDTRQLSYAIQSMLKIYDILRGSIELAFLF